MYMYLYYLNKNYQQTRVQLPPAVAGGRQAVDFGWQLMCHRGINYLTL